MMDITQVLDEELIDLDLKGTTKDEVLQELCQLLAEKGRITDQKAFLTDVYLREAEGDTGLGNHIAIPHGKSTAVLQTSIAIGRTKNAIEWESLDDLPVHCIILFAVRDVDQTTVHLKLLAQIAGSLADEELLEKLLTVETPAELTALLGK